MAAQRKHEDVAIWPEPQGLCASKLNTHLAWICLTMHS